MVVIDLITLRDMGLKSKDLIAACAEAGVKMTKERSSRIINGTTLIKPAEMEVIAKLVHKAVDDLYVELGSVQEVACPLLSIGAQSLIMCCRQQCAWWNWQLQCCTVKTLEGVIKKTAGGDINV
jgi:hypothetical protein